MAERHPRVAKERPTEPQAGATASVASPAGPAAVYEALLDFANATWRRSLEAGAALSRCRSPAEVAAAQTAHAWAMAQGYLALSLKLMQLGAGAAFAPWSASQRFDRWGR